MNSQFRQAVLLVVLSALASGQGISRPDVPYRIKAPAGQNIVLQAHASGSQVYVCAQGLDQKYSWTLKAPDADLHDQQGTVIGRHYAGPTWKHKDGSVVTGKAAARVDSPDPDSIPWLLVNATGHFGSGVFSGVTSIQRIHTKGGQPPAAAECNGAMEKAEVKSSYAADYYFYAPAK